MATLVTLDGVIQDPGAFGETEQGGRDNPHFTEDAQQDAYEHLMASDYFLCGCAAATGSHRPCRRRWGRRRSEWSMRCRDSSFLRDSPGLCSADSEMRCGSSP